MGKIGKMTGPSDAIQAGEPLHLQQAEVIPGSRPDSAQVATTASVLAEGRESDAERAQIAGDAGILEKAEEVLDRPENEGVDRPADSEHRDDEAGDALSGDEALTQHADPGDEEDRDDTGTGEVDEVDDPEDEDDADDLPAEVNEPEGAVVVTPEQYEPADHNVAEVNEYLDGIDRDTPEGEAEYQRVLDAESSVTGKGRLGVLQGRV